MKIKVSKVHLQVLKGHSFFTPFRDIINTRMVGKICFTIRSFNISRVSGDLHYKQQNKEVLRDTDQQKAVQLRLKSIKVDFFQTNNEITLTRVCVCVCVCVFF